ncbi:MAG: hypothetical protein PHI12_06795 [Dehalococcoidales bacterium]|nr:hypothetical protein [Dehalococcoidales bacterium]
MKAVTKKKVKMTTIQVEETTAKMLQSLGKWGDTYNTVILRLLNGNKPKDKGGPHGGLKDESTGDGDH